MMKSSQHSDDAEESAYKREDSCKDKKIVSLGWWCLNGAAT